MTPRVLLRFAALMGIVGAAVVLAVAELLSLIFGAAGSPLFAVGSLVIDSVPGWVKNVVVALFGTGDKAALLVILGIVIIVLAALAGVLELRRSPFGVILFGIAAIVALIAVVTRSGSTSINALPTIVGAVVGVVVLRIGIQRLTAWQASDERRVAAAAAFEERTGRASNSGAGPQVERRKFLTLAVASGVASVVVATGARLANAGTTTVAAVRQKLKLPTPTTTAPPVPPGASLDVTGISPIVTPVADFYRIDTALQIPAVNSDDWTLKITGMVDNPISIDFKELLAKPLTEHMATLTCVSNDVGGDLIGNALWLGYPIRELLAKAGPKAGADMVLSTSIDGFTAGTPLDVLQDVGTEALLAVGMNGKPLTAEHGFPVRMVVPGLYGYVSATKWVVSLEVTKFSKAEGYWTPRGWSAKGPIKLSSRIDTPLDGASVADGKIPIAGVAWCQHVGVSKVEVQIDGGSWQDATLADSISADTWRQWVYYWPATKGRHEAKVRATDANGVTQKSTYVPPDPNGSEGYASITFTVK
jgi:DMSO/TMAO reductase YedYZ molybdopterin-dependent catalytic subunit